MSKLGQVIPRLLIPLLWALALHLNPRPLDYDMAQSAAWQARLQADPAQESQALRAIAAFQPWRGDMWERIGELASQSQDWSGAVQAYRQAERYAALPASGIKALGEAYWQQNNQSSAIDAWQPLLRSGEAGADLFRQVVEYQRAQGDFSGAARTLSLWQTAEPSDAQVLYNLGLLMLLDHPDEGLGYLARAAGLDANFTQDVYMLRQTFDRDVPSSMDEGRALARLGEWDLAVAFNRRAVSEQPGSAEAWAYLGEALDQSGQSGADAFQHALELDPNSVPARAEAALHWRRQGNLDRALTYFQSLAREQPDKGMWQLEIGNTLAADGKLSDAMVNYRRALELEPGNAYYWSVVAGVCADNFYELRQTGLPAAREALLLSPNNPGYLDLMGVIMMKLEDFNSAERFLQQALQKNAQLASVHFHLGQLYLYRERPELAYRSLVKAETLAGSKSNVGKLAKRLLDRYFPGAASLSEQP